MNDALKSGSNIQTSSDFLRVYAPNLFDKNANIWKLIDLFGGRDNSFKQIEVTVR